MSELSYLIRTNTAQDAAALFGVLDKGTALSVYEDLAC